MYCIIVIIIIIIIIHIYIYIYNPSTKVSSSSCGMITGTPTRDDYRVRSTRYDTSPAQ